MDNRTERFHFGAFPKSDGVYFSVWAPEAKTVEISFYEPKDFSLENSKPIKTISLTKKEQEKGAGVWELLTKEVKSGALYKYTVDGKGPFPDPSSRFQPHGVHGPSQVIDPTAFKWNDQDWTNRLKDPKSRSFAADLIIYELHIGTFTKEGTYKSAQQKLDYLKELGITAIEILPLSDFPGRWNWGYDGVMLYSPARCYGDPDELREFIDAAHSKGLYVLLDAVYNHFGPDGNYTGCYSPYYFTEKHHTPWGPAPNIDLSLGKDKSSPEYMNALQVRRFLIENGIYWIEEFHFDGFRLDATHALVDNSTPHFLLEFVQSCNNNVLGKNVFVFAEDDRNSTLLLKEPMEGYGLDGAWADDFHHQVRVNLAGDRESYFANFTGETKDLAKTIKQGWFYAGQLCGEEHRGTDPTIIPLMSKFSYCIQNHDQIGNRAFGDRLNHKISGNAYKVASALVLLVPQTPLLFMGQEFSSKSPFQFFTDHNESLGKLVTEGRRKEFAKFSAFNDPQLREKIPDPQAESTFVNSKLNFDEISMKEHKNIFEFYKKLIAFRKSEDALKNCERSQFDVVDLSESAIGLLRKSNQKSVLAIFNFNGNSVINLDEALTKLGANSKKLTIAFTSDDDLYRLENDSAPVVTLEEGKQQIQFNGPSVVVFYL